MSNRDSKRTQQTTGTQRRGKRRTSRSRSRLSPYWLIAGAVAVTVLSLVNTRDASAHHPDPRPAVTSADVKPASEYSRYPRVASVYRQAMEIPHVLDGLYCYCQCSEHSGHYSLLDCFRSDHGAGCDICLSEAALAYRMSQDGQTLDEIRGAIDQLYKR